jgi:hypothetical protein
MNEVKPEQALTEMTTQSNIPPSVVVQVNISWPQQTTV